MISLPSSIWALKLNASSVEDISMMVESGSSDVLAFSTFHWNGLTTGKDYYQELCWKKNSAENWSPEKQLAVPIDLSEPWFWASLTDKTRKLIGVYNDVVHWRPVFFSLGRKKEGYEWVNQLNKLMQNSTGESNRSSVSMIAATASPHLVLAKTENIYDDSIEKTTSRRVSEWKRAHIENSFNEAKALQSR